MSANVENAADPFALKVELPICVAPSMKFTVPVGVPAPLGLTTAVNVSSGKLELDFRRVVLPVFTACPRTGEVLVLKLVSPL